MSQDKVRFYSDVARSTFSPPVRPIPETLTLQRSKHPSESDEPVAF
jgi:hypothetical protein